MCLAPLISHAQSARKSTGNELIFSNVGFFTILILLILVIVFLIIRIKQITKQLSTQQQQLEKLSRIDDQTQLFNKWYFLKRLYEDFELYLRNPQTEAVLLMIDLDHFKNINETYGHASGDLVLEIVARIITQRTRKTDLCARYGGKEFLLLLRNTNADNAFKLAEELRADIQATKIQLADENINITCSIGIAAYNKQLQTCHDWIQYADKAMHLSKRKGRNRSTVHQAD